MVAAGVGVGPQRKTKVMNDEWEKEEDPCGAWLRRGFMGFVMLFGLNLLHCGPWTVDFYIGNSVIYRCVYSNSNIVRLFLVQFFDGFASQIAITS